MKATVVDLRYHMNDVLKALDRNEDVDILYRGKRKGVLTATADRTATKVEKHPFFNMRSSKRSVETEMNRLRGGRYRDI
ncbi:MAG TPA: type II toxin-antitoxin system Phd/YefM family antitoxin [bacterium]|nr:type II toxin-antitoxin system Phd/YefM family antitoxin [bacterium]